MTDDHYRAAHLGGLRRFAIAITVLNVLGHAWFGFEQSLAQPLVALATAYGTELLLEVVDAACNRRRPRFAGGVRQLIDFLLSAHISGLAVAMLLYPNDRLWVIAFGAATAIGSKAVFRVVVGSTTRHFFNPSNFGISVTLLLFPWVGICPPYHFTENLSGPGDWILPGLIILTGSFLNTRFTHRLPLIGAWVGCFALQAAVRSLWFDTPLVAPLAMMTGVTFVLYTFYMVTDPATTPSRPWAQAAFGAAVAAAYGVLTTVHIVFGLFFALSSVCAARGVGLYILNKLSARERGSEPFSVPTAPIRVPILAGGEAK
jgi:enediyne biosynthesis protein E5